LNIVTFYKTKILAVSNKITEPSLFYLTASSAGPIVRCCPGTRRPRRPHCRAPNAPAPRSVLHVTLTPTDPTVRREIFGCFGTPPAERRDLIGEYAIDVRGCGPASPSPPLLPPLTSPPPPPGFFLPSCCVLSAFNASGKNCGFSKSSHLDLITSQISSVPQFSPYFSRAFLNLPKMSPEHNGSSECIVGCGLWFVVWGLMSRRTSWRFIMRPIL